MKHKSESVLEPGDARTRRTRIRIDEAFVGLLHGRSYQAIRVSDIAKKAHIGRATFYAHYETKSALLRSQFTRLVEPLICLRPADACLFDCTALFAHVLSARRLYRSLAGERVVRECLEHRLRTLLEQSKLRLSVQPPLISCLIASSLNGFVDWWLEHESADSAARMQATWSAIVGGGIGYVRSSPRSAS